MGAEYVQCLVCGKMTPVRKGVCYHCSAPLPTRISLPPGYIVCPNCLRPTPVDTGYCRRCNAYLPPSLVRSAMESLMEAMARAAEERRVIGPIIGIGPIGFMVTPGDRRWRYLGSQKAWSHAPTATE